MAKITIDIQCPKCHFMVKAEIKKFFKFVMYCCPNCGSNVVFYNNKIDIISDKFLEKLKKKKRFQFCGDAIFSMNVKSNKKSSITKNQILDLKILLETVKDFDEFLSKI